MFLPLTKSVFLTETRYCVHADVVVVDILVKLLVFHEEKPVDSLKVKSLKVLLRLMTSRQLYQSIAPLVVKRSCWSNIMLRSCMSDVFWELVTILGLCQSEHCDDVEFLSFTK